MKIIYYLLPCLLVSCEAFPTAGGSTTAADPGIGTAAIQVAVDAATGNYVAAAIGAGSIVLGLLGWKGGKRVAQKVKDAPSGKML